MRPALFDLGMQYASREAEYLLLATAAHESRLSYLRQLNGPALGVYQMEPATLDDLYENYLAYRGPTMPPRDCERLIYDLRYATQVARLHYYRFPERLPPAWDAEAQWQLYKLRWNTPLGAATREQFVAAWQQCVEPVLTSPVERA